jgi:UDP-N-acetylmuramoyl-tripeptide--D-alanyl-D-alanine ligase
METRSVKFLMAASSASLLYGAAETLVGRVCTDSRQVQPGDLFCALSGERFDGHEFLRQAALKGAAAVLVESGKAIPDLGPCAILSVPDNTRAALARLAARYRRDFSLPVVAVAGSNGKTTTKELIAAVLRQKLATLWSEDSFNNAVGVPLSLLRLEASHQAAVLEAGTNHPGELAPLLAMIAPGLGVLTNIGREHLEFFGDLEGVAREEGCLAEVLPKTGRLFLNGDCAWAGRIAQRTQAAVVRVGFAEANDWRARRLRLSSQGVRFQVEGPAPELEGEYSIHLLGRHQVVNALFAIAVGHELGLSRAEIEPGLETCRAPKMRLESWDFHGVRVLDDAYNANADSMLAALRTLHDLPCKGRRVAVLGDMAELGRHSEAAHEEIGRRAAELGVGQLFVVGGMAPVTARGAREAGLHRVLEFADVDAAGAAVCGFVRNGDVLLLKASRRAGLERISQILKSAVRKGDFQAARCACPN